MKLIPNWRAVLARAWTVRLAILYGVISAASTYWFAFADVVPPVTFMAVGIVLAVLTVVARVVDQGIEK